MPLLFIFLLEFALGKDTVTFLWLKHFTLSGHILETLQDLSNDHSRSDAINGYEALDFLNELVQSSRSSHEHESHRHGDIADVDFNLVKNEETEIKGIFNGKGHTVSPYTDCLSIILFVTVYIQN